MNRAPAFFAARGQPAEFKRACCLSAHCNRNRFVNFVNRDFSHANAFIKAHGGEIARGSRYEKSRVLTIQSGIQQKPDMLSKRGFIDRKVGTVNERGGNGYVAALQFRFKAGLRPQLSPIQVSIGHCSNRIPPIPCPRRQKSTTLRELVFTRHIAGTEFAKIRRRNPGIY